MKIVAVFGITILSTLMISPVPAGSLDKYRDDFPATSVYQQQFSPDEMKRRLNEKMKRAIQILNTMEGEEKEHWINEYKNRLEEALASGNHLKAAYYRGILEGAE